MRLTDIRTLVVPALLCIATAAAADEAGQPVLRGLLTNGNTFHLQQHVGKVVMINFWATWCPACRADYPVWQKVYERYRERGLEIVAVSIDRNEADLARFEQQHGYTIPILWRFDERERDSFPAIRKTPTTYFIAPDGTVALVQTGRTTEDQLADILEVLLPE